MAPRTKDVEKKVINQIPDEFKLLKMDIVDYVFSKAQSDYYFSLLFGIELKRSQRHTEELFRRGALIKIHSEKDNKAKFYPTPPTFMFFIDELGIGMIKKHKAAIEELENIYFEKYCNKKNSLLKQKLIFFSAKGHHLFQGLQAFLVKKYLKEKAYFCFADIDELSYNQFKIALGSRLKKITVFLPSHNKRQIMTDFKKIKEIDKRILLKERFVVIDDLFLINIFSLRDLRNNRILYGYISTCHQDVKEGNEKVDLLYYL